MTKQPSSGIALFPMAGKGRDGEGEGNKACLMQSCQFTGIHEGDEAHREDH